LVPGLYLRYIKQTVMSEHAAEAVRT
jgi:hypothetical protein